MNGKRFVRNYIGARGGVPVLSEEEKEALASMISEGFDTYPEFKKKGLEIGKDRAKWAKTLFGTRPWKVIKDRDFGGGVPHEITVVRSKNAVLVYPQAPEYLEITINQPRMGDWRRYPDFVAFVKVAGGKVVVTAQQRHLNWYSNLETAARDIVLDAMLSKREAAIVRKNPQSNLEWVVGGTGKA